MMFAEGALRPGSHSGKPGFQEELPPLEEQAFLL